jgi:hypothetical protein
MSEASPTEPAFSGRIRIPSLFRVASFPRDWPARAAAVIGLSLLMIVLCIWVGARFHADPDYWFGEKKPGTFWSVGLLVASGTVCLRIRKICPAAMRGFWLFSGLLLCFTALDDLVGIHERTDRMIHALLGWNPDDPLTDHIDDVLVLGYILPAGWLWFTHRREIVQLRLMVQMFVVAAVFFLGTVAVDMLLPLEWLEESLKIVAAALILCGFLAAYSSQRDASQTRAGTSA